MEDRKDIFFFWQALQARLSGYSQMGSQRLTPFSLNTCFHMNILLLGLPVKLWVFHEFIPPKLLLLRSCLDRVYIKGLGI